MDQPKHIFLKVNTVMHRMTKEEYNNREMGIDIDIDPEEVFSSPSIINMTYIRSIVMNPDNNNAILIPVDMPTVIETSTNYFNLIQSLSEVKGVAIVSEQEY